MGFNSEFKGLKLVFNWGFVGIERNRRARNSQWQVLSAQ